MPTYPLDTVAGAYFGVGLRLLTAGYAGSCATLRRASDNATLNVGFDSATKFVDMASVAAWLGISNTVKSWEDAYGLGNVAYVTTWYDQSGNARHLTNGTSVSAILRLDFKGLPIVRLGPSSRLVNAWGTLPQPYSMATAGRCFAPSFFLPNTSDIYAGMTNTTMAPHNLYGGANSVGAAATPTIMGQRHVGVGVFSGATSVFNYDGADSPVANGGTAAAGGFQLNALSNVRGSYIDVHEFLVWSKGLSPSERAAVSADLMTVWPSGPVETPSMGLILVED